MRGSDAAAPRSPGGWRERGGRLVLGLYFSLPCVASVAVAIVRARRGDVGVALALGFAAVLAIGAIQAWRGKFLIPAVYIAFVLVSNVVSSFGGETGAPVRHVLAESAFLAVAIAWLVARRFGSGVSSERVRGGLSTLLAVAFLGWSISFAVGLGKGLGAVLVRQPKEKQAIALVKGQRVPPAHFLDASGKVEDLQGEGVVYVVNFWATWCSPCLEELPHLQTVMEETPRDGRVRFLAVNTEELDRDAVDAFAREHGFGRLQIYLDPKSSRDAFDVTRIPVTLVVKDGVVLARYDGYTRRVISKLRSVIEKELGA